VRVLVTGGSGNLGLVLADLFTKHSIDVTLVDKRPSPDGRRVEIADILDFEEMVRLCRGHDVVVHTAALHGIHREMATELDFLRLNVLGAHNVLTAASRAEAKRAIYLSSTSVYGVTRRSNSGVAAYCDESTPIAPRDINDLCKALGEQLCEYFERVTGMQCIRLRCGRFFADGWASFNVAKLSGAIDVVDVAQAVYLATTAERIPTSLLCVASPTRFQVEDLAALAQAPEQVIEKRYPGVTALFAAHMIEFPKSIHRVVDTAAAREALGFEAEASFERFLGELASIGEAR